MLRAISKSNSAKKMTTEEFAKLRWKMYIHLSMESEYACSYTCVDMPMLQKCVHTPVKEDFSFGRAYAHYMFQGKTHKTKKKFLEAMTEFEEERKSKFEKG